MKQPKHVYFKIRNFIPWQVLIFTSLHIDSAVNSMNLLSPYLAIKRTELTSKCVFQPQP